MSTGPFCLVLALGSPPVFLSEVVWDEQQNRYILAERPEKDQKSYDIYTNFVMSFHLGLGIAVMISSALAIGGMLKAAAHRRKVMRGSQQNAEMGAQMRREKQLCILLLALIIPMELKLICLYIGNRFYIDPFAYDAKGQVVWSYLYAYEAVWFAVNLANVFEHCFHFFLYMIFSSGFRAGFRKRFKRQRIAPAPAPAVHVIAVKAAPNNAG